MGVTVVHSARQMILLLFIKLECEMLIVPNENKQMDSRDFFQRNLKVTGLNIASVLSCPVLSNECPWLTDVKQLLRVADTDIFIECTDFKARGTIMCL